MILDDDHGGIFSFDDAEVEVVESVGTFELELKRISGARGKVAIPYNTEDGTAKEGEHYEAQEGELIFNNEETSKAISLEITDEESYEKNLIMYVNIGEPRQIAEGIEGEGIDYSILDAKNPEDLTEEEKVALLGRPRHGDNSRIMVRIRESKEFKSSVDKMMQKANNSMMVGSSSWLDQFTDAFTVQAEDDSDEEKEKIEEIVNEKISWLEENQEADADELKAQKKEMEDIIQPIIAKLYQGAGGAPGEGEEEGEGGEDDEDLKDEL